MVLKDGAPIFRKILIFLHRVSKFTKKNYFLNTSYEGTWENNRKNEKSGSGVMKYSNGDQYKGTWNDGEIVVEKTSSGMSVSGGYRICRQGEQMP